jgi:hypothetical protein
MMIAKLTVLPERNKIATTFRSGVETWRKEYEDMPDATAEAVELQVMTPELKRLVDAAQRQPSWPKGYAPDEGVEVDIEELHTRGFLRASWKPGTGPASRIA